MEAALYARVSTTDRGQDPEMQLRELQEYCERRGWIPHVFIDRVSSGKLRPQLETLKTLCRRRKFDVVMVYRFDRFARSLVELLTALEEFSVLKVAFVSLHENVDTTTPQGKLMFSIIGAFAEFERELIRDRVRSGIALARSRGAILGRPRLNRDGSQIAVLRAQGVTWREIAESLGVSRSTVIRTFLEYQKTPLNTVQ
jgi:DNA invertase Pin-like site-specific DNA recombinase